MSMIQRPTAVGLTLCQMLTVEEHTRNITLVNSFHRMYLDEFPSALVPFFVYTVLTDGLGEVKLDLVISRCDTLEDIYIRSFKTVFIDPLRQLQLYWHVRSCTCPSPGSYQLSLEVDGESITQCTLKIRRKGETHG